MKKDGGRQTASSILWIAVSVLVNYLVTFYLTQEITESIGAEAYGFVSLAKSFISYVSILTIALNTFAARYISIAYHQQNKDLVNQYVTSVFYADVVLGVVLLAASGVMVYYLEYLLAIPAELVADVKALFFLSFVNFTLMSVATAFSATPVVLNRMDITGKIKCASYVLEALFLLVIYNVCEARVYYIGVGSVIVGLFVLTAYGFITRKMMPDVTVNHRLFSMSAVKALLLNGMWSSINSIGNILNTGLDLLISNMMLSALEMGQLAIVKTISTIFSTIYSTITQPFQPLMLKAFAQNNRERLMQILNIAITVCGMFTNILFAGFVVFGAVYYHLWTPSQDSQLMSMLTNIAILGTIIEGGVYPIYYVYTLTLRNKVPCFVTIASGVLNVVSMYLLITYTDLRMTAVLLTTTVLSWIVNFIFNPQYAAHSLGLKRSAFYPILIKNCISSAVLCLAFKGIAMIYMPSAWIGLIAVAIVCAIIGCVIHLAVMLNRKEIGMIITKLKKVVKRF